jgi:hypothetical protein
MPAPPLPPPDVPIVNPETGLVDRDWYDWFRGLGVADTGGDVFDGQLAFPATQNPSSDPNTLDDYEEGDWTPVPTFATPGSFSFSPTAQAGRYVKIGKLVQFTLNLQGSTSNVGTASGQLRVTGLPFAHDTFSQQSGGSVVFAGINVAGFTTINAAIDSGNTFMYFVASKMGSGLGDVPVNVDATHVGTILVLAGGGTYRAAA